MKLLTLSPVSRQLIILGLIVALLWYGSGPVIRPDGRIVCCSTDYRAISFLNHLRPTDEFPATVDIVQLAYGNAGGLQLLNLPVTHKHHAQPNKLLQLAIDYVPGLVEIRRIRSKANGGWIIYFSVTPEQFEQLNKMIENDGLLLFQ